MPNLNENQFPQQEPLFDPGPSHEGEPWLQRQHEFMARPDVQWHSSRDPIRDWEPYRATHAGTLSAAADRASSTGGEGYLYPMALDESQMQWQPGPVSDAYANIASNDDSFAMDDYLNEFADEQGDLGDDDYDYDDHELQDTIRFAREDYETLGGLRYTNDHEDTGSISVVAPKSALTTHGELVDQAVGEGLPVPPGVRAEREYLRDHPPRAKDVRHALLTNEQQFGNVGESIRSPAVEESHEHRLSHQPPELGQLPGTAYKPSDAWSRMGRNPRA